MDVPWFVNSLRFCYIFWFFPCDNFNIIGIFITWVNVPIFLLSVLHSEMSTLLLQSMFWSFQENQLPVYLRLPRMIHRYVYLCGEHHLNTTVEQVYQHRKKYGLAQWLYWYAYEQCTKHNYDSETISDCVNNLLLDCKISLVKESSRL